MSDTMNKIRNLKKEAIARCVERIEKAKKNPQRKEEWCFTSALKKNRGL